VDCLKVSRIYHIITSDRTKHIKSYYLMTFYWIRA